MRRAPATAVHDSRSAAGVGRLPAMPSPVFNDETMKRDANGWAAPQRGTHAPVEPGDGPVTAWQRGMTVNGTITASLVLFVMLLVSASFGWSAASGPTLENGQETYQFPTIAIGGIIIGFIAVIAAYFKPRLAKFLGPVYAIGYGFAVGAISKGYETFYDGIVLQAVGATLAVFVTMLVLYRTRIIKVTEKFRRTVIFATIGIMVMYGVSFLIQLFGGSVPYLNSPSLLGIGLSVVICVVASLNLALDFDLIERGSKTGLAKDYEWVAALGLVVTVVWLYLEMLRLLSLLQQR
jgi:uncharacterized YccA/Bax inhibitor family protein